MDEEVSTEKTAATDGVDTGRGPTTTRRTLLIAETAAATAAVAGCSGISDQSFESSPVTLSTESQDQLRLEEMEARSETITATLGPLVER